MDDDDDLLNNEWNQQLPQINMKNHCIFKENKFTDGQWKPKLKKKKKITDWLPKNKEKRDSQQLFYIQFGDNGKRKAFWQKSPNRPGMI